jgi:hypothetical protein
MIRQKFDELQPKQKMVLAGACLFLCLVFLISFFNRAPENAARPDQVFNIRAFGALPDLNEAMRDNAKINNIVQDLLSYDEVYIFVNYGQINALLAELLFLWAGITEQQLKEIGAQRAISTFIRGAYALPPDEPILNNPLLEDNPWGDLFNRFKAQILMQGQGYKIYDGLAYFDNQTDAMVIEGEISKNFVKGFAEFLETQDNQTRSKYVNNFLLFIRDTKSFVNLSQEDKELIQRLKGL